jgi:hypothetical protein
LSYVIKARLLGLVIAIVLGVGGAVSLSSNASADGGLVDLSLSSEAEGGVLDVLDPVLEVTEDLGVDLIEGGEASAESDADVEGDVTVSDTEVEGDASADAGTEAVLSEGADVLGLAEGDGGLIDLDDEGLIDLGEGQDGGLVDVDDLLDGDGGLIDISDDDAGDDGANDDAAGNGSGTGDILEPVTGLLGGDDNTGDVLEPVTGLLGDGDGGLIDTDDEGLIDLGDDQNGGLLDVDDLLNGGGLLDTSGDDAGDDGANDDATGGNNGGTLDILEPVTGLLGAGSDNGETLDILEPVTGLLGGDGELTSDGLDACIGVEPLDVVVETGDGCNQEQDCESIDVNCLLGDVLAPVIDEGALLDPIVDVCLGVGGLAGADSGEACGASFGQDDELCDAVAGSDCLIDDVTDILGEDGNDGPLDLCLSIDPLDTTALAGAGCNQDPGCGLLSLNCIVDDTHGPVTGPDGLVDPNLDACVGLGAVKLELGAGCGDEIVSPCTPNSDPT